jgi:hypothetical protein
MRTGRQKQKGGIAIRIEPRKPEGYLTRNTALPKGELKMKTQNVSKPNIEKLAERQDIEGLIAALTYEEPCTLSSEEAIRVSAPGDIFFRNPFGEEDDYNLNEATRIYRKAGGEWLQSSLRFNFKDKDWCIRGDAARALGEIGDTRAVEPLIQALRDTDNYVRREAADALGWIQDVRAVDPLIQSLKDEDEFVRGLAAFSLGIIKDARTTDSLMQLLRDENRDVRETAAWALGELVEPKCSKSSKEPER